jgi:hypothetical protein
MYLCCVDEIGICMGRNGIEDKAVGAWTSQIYRNLSKMSSSKNIDLGWSMDELNI